MVPAPSRVRKHFFFKKVFLCFKKVFRKEKRFLRSTPKTLLRTHFPSKKVVGTIENEHKRAQMSVNVCK